ncbi:LysR family transcriptional regulator [Streptomyces cocklensis]|jgi:DNA-binding transcriptional LysR family regulator|uniref:LysR-family transcriptional regulator n=1 Tax=Actinacidiphila cocklensis TaxID=887465 RepID=A0A9W4DJF5_9ACTN|nr:LysR family transcriptional regulator [Actinacidiphila cocklensis]MDD1063660.1 LysR family transcriptional regulator [Actinacidiphila cocklensis]WSX72858.1 LysR family transcriptional regulator [Streptomyces sp. NBC_00899]WSX81074.1 LysR family transcriptional regulator [Streptomyces sp. NBC_00899]CAG6391135.1 putative LysR-family transcriptional regulator [Actinacidiphila cocklensis]
MIEARRLHILRALSDHRTVTAAAAALHLTPSAVSQQLAALEQETRHRLVERSGRGVRLTPAGDILLRHTNAVLAQLERAEAELVAYSSGAAGTVTVASFATGISLAVAPALVRLARVAPGIKVRVQDAEGDASLRMVLDRQVDVAVAVEYRGAPAADDARLVRVPLYAEPFDAVLPVTHPLAGAERVALAELAGAPWIGPYPGNPCRDVVVLACEAAGFQPAFEHQSDDFHAVVSLTSAGAGVALVPRSALRGVDLGGAVVRPVDGVAPTRRVFAAVRCGAEEHPLIRPVLDALLEAAAGRPAREGREGSVRIVG